jgi:hypothetical protein
MTTYLIYIKEIFIIVFLSFMMGSVLLKIADSSINKQYTKTFLSLLTGILILTIVQASMVSKFNTVLLITPFILWLGFCADKKRIGKCIKSRDYGLWQLKSYISLSTFVELSFFIFLVYSLQFFLLFENGNIFSIKLPSQDLTFYARCADYLSATGIEFCNNDYLFSASSKPYHFADLWFNSVISSLGGNNTAMSLVLTFKTIYLTIFYIGILAILENKYQLNYKIKIICGLTIFFTPLYISAYDNFHILTEMTIFSQTFSQAQKLFFIEVFLLAAILLNIINYRKLAVATILCLPVVYTVTMVPVFAGFLVYLIYVYLSDKEIAYDELAIGIIPAIYILGYYFVFNSSSDEVNPYAFNLLDIVNFRHTTNIVAGTLLKHIILFFPVGILFFLYVRNKRSDKNIFLVIKSNSICIFILSLPMFGLILWSITSGDPNAVQLFQNISMPILYTISIILILISFIELSLHYKWLIFLLLIANAFFQVKDLIEIKPSHGKYFIQQLMQKKIAENKIYVTYKPISWYSSFFSFGDKGINLGNYLAYFYNNTQPVSLDMIDVPIIGDVNFVKNVNKSIKSSTFQQYINEKKRIGINKKNYEYQLDFIRENNVRILITLKSVNLPTHLSRLVVERIEDNISDEVVCILAD